MRSGGEAPEIMRPGDLSAARELLAHGEHDSAWKRCVESIRERPFHPEGFLLAGEIARSAGDISTGRLCLQRARGMAPGLVPPESSPEHASTNEQKVYTWPDLEFLLAQTPPRLSVCLIVKNEEAFLGQCLRSVQSIASEIIVVDTGSTDRSLEIARECGAKVFEFTWIDDFAAARNASMVHARGDWILILDADEELTSGAAEHIASEMANPKVMAFNLPLVNEGRLEEGAVFLSRLFRNIPGTCFEGRVHEQLLNSMIARTRGWGLDVGQSRATLLHHGYSAAVTASRNKPARNLHLLQKALAEEPKDALARAYLLMNIGLETVRTGDLAEGIKHYERALALLNDIATKALIAPEFRATFLHQLAPYYHRAGRPKDVLRLYQTAFGKSGEPSASDHYQLGLAHGQEGHFEQAAKEFRACLAKRRQPTRVPNHAVILGPAPYQCLASALVQLKRNTEAEKTYQQGLAEHGQPLDLAVEYARFKVNQGRALEALRDTHQMLANHTGNPVVWALGAEIALCDPRFREVAMDWTAEAIQRHGSDFRIVALRTEALLLASDVQGAKQTLGKIAPPSDLDPRSRAVLILVSLLENAPVEMKLEARDEVRTSQVFLDVFRRLVLNGASNTAALIKQQVGRLQSILPSAANALRKLAL